MPDWPREIRRRLEPLALPAGREAEIVEELAQHLDDRVRELCGRGLSADAAERAALDELTGEEGHALAAALAAAVPRATPRASVGTPANGAGPLARLGQDLRYALRSLRRQPGVAAVATLTLALGIGANALLFGVVETVLLRPLPYRDPDRLVSAWLTAPEKGLPEVALTHALVAFYRERSRTLQGLGAYGGAGLTLTGGCASPGGECEPERLTGASITHDLFAIAGARPVLGRGFLPDEDRPDQDRIAVLSYGLWQRRFGGDTSIVGRAITLNGVPTTVVGVMPPGFRYPGRSEVWVPLGLDPARTSPWYLWTLGRLAPGRTPDDARREIEAMTDEFKRRHTEIFPSAERERSRAVVQPLAQTIVGGVRLPLLVLLGAVGLVLLIACANIANLLLARAAARQREIAVRCCLGASPRRIAAQLLTESLLLAAAGAAGGLLLATAGVRALRGLPTAVVPRIDQLRLDPTVLLFTLALALATGLVFGLAPALRARRVDLQDVLREGTRGTGGAATRRLSDGFVIVQLALSLVLLAGAGLLLRSFQRLMAEDPGFRPERVLVARLQLPWPTYADAAPVRVFYERLLERVRALPGVRDAGLTQSVPLTPGNPQNEFIVEGREPAPSEPVPVAAIRHVTPGYFEAIGTPILRGRGFLPTDRDSAPPVAVVDETLARRYWPGESALGKRVRAGREAADFPWLTVVGVAAAVKHARLDEAPGYHIYLPHAQSVRWTMYLVARAGGDPLPLAAAIRREVAALDPQVPLYDVQTMTAAVGQALATRRLTNLLLGGFALAALLLAAIGIYGVMALNVSGRTREFGVRLALGARPADVMRLVLGQGMRLALPGVALGLVGALMLTRLLRSLLFGVGPFDLLTFASVALLLLTVALAACWLPARRATRADPIAALRYE